MPIKKAACPNCGGIANITVNSKDDDIKKISSTGSPTGVSRSNNYESACIDCGETIYYWLK